MDITVEDLVKIVSDAKEVEFEVAVEIILSIAKLASIRGETSVEIVEPLILQAVERNYDIVDYLKYNINIYTFLAYEEDVIKSIILDWSEY